MDTNTTTLNSITTILRQSTDLEEIQDYLGMKWHNGTAIGGCNFVKSIIEWKSIIQCHAKLHEWRESEFTRGHSN